MGRWTAASKAVQLESHLVFIVVKRGHELAHEGFAQDDCVRAVLNELVRDQKCTASFVVVVDVGLGRHRVDNLFNLEFEGRQLVDVGAALISVRVADVGEFVDFAFLVAADDLFIARRVACFDELCHQSPIVSEREHDRSSGHVRNYDFCFDLLFLSVELEVGKIQLPKATFCIFLGD